MSTYVDLSQLTFFQVDQTSHCNLRCPQCARTHAGGVNPDLPLTQLTLDDYTTIFDVNLLARMPNLKNFTFSGNYGDAAASNTLKPALQYLRKNKVPSFSVMTNGSLRTPDWWRDLALVMDSKYDKVVFAIDGLEDTNSTYRVNSNWQTIIENAKAYIDAGGKARWDFLVFEHNAHQVEAAKTIAKQMGFFEFAIKKTNRFINDQNYRSGKASFTQSVSVQKNQYTIEVPQQDTRYAAKSTSNFEKIVEKHGSWNEYINKTKISCLYRKWGHGLFLDFEARLWPCTWLASPIYHYGETNSQKKQIQQLFERYGSDFNNIRKHGFWNVFNHKWFQSELVTSWENKVDDSVAKLLTCGRTCGEEYDFSSASANNRTIERLKEAHER